MVKFVSLQFSKWYVIASPWGSNDFFQTKVIVVAIPVAPFAGETSTGFEGGLLPVVPVAVPPEPFTVMITDVWPVTLVGTSNVSVTWPSAVGAKWSDSVQVVDGAIVAPEQVLFVILKGAASGSAFAIVPRTRFAVPVFVMVTVASAELPTVTPPNGMVRSFAGGMESVTEMPGTVVGLPVPLKAKAKAGVTGSLLGMVKVPDEVTAAVGVKPIVIAQVVGGRGICVSLRPEQPSAVKLNGAAGGAIVPMSRGPSPALPNVMI